MARCCWRRRMPPDTAVAVPATTVVVAAAPMRCMPGPLRPPLRPNGGISVPFLGCSCVLERCVDHSQRRSLHIEHHAVRRGNSVPEARRPDVLPNENGGRGVGLQPLTDGGQVIAVHEIADLGLEPLKRPAGIGVEVLELERGDIAVAILLDEGDVQDPNGLRLHQLLQSGYQVPRELVAWKGNDQVLHRADRHLVLLRRSVSPRARRAGYVRPVSGGRPGPVLTRGDGHPGESAAGSRKNCQREQPWPLSGGPTRGRAGWYEATRLRPPICSFAAVRLPLAPTGKEAERPAAPLAGPNASSSWLASTCWPLRLANERAVRMWSAKPTAKMPTAAGSNWRVLPMPTPGHVSRGRPRGMCPTVATP